MMTQTAALAAQQQARPDGSASATDAMAVSPGTSRAAVLLCQADGCRNLAFMASSVPGRGLEPEET